MALTQKRAIQRSSVIEQESISYRFHLVLEPGSSYTGLSQLSFTLTSIPTQLALCSKAKQITKVITNGTNQEQDKIRHEDGFLYLDVGTLKIGKNLVAVAYRNKYDNDGNGCVSFVDVDAKQYIYTQFEPYNANRVFVLFDQPDLKATMELTIVSPMEWEKVLSNEYATLDAEFDAANHIAKIPTDHQQALSSFFENAKGRINIFPKTKLLPTYLFCFVAGPYKQLKLQHTYKNIPMSLYCIESLFPYLEGMAPFIFEITIESMKFFESFFGVEYPFDKYDQVFAHQYKMGAMENAGIVTFNDQYIEKEKVSVERMLEFADTISHELSHHWFGNLSTMKWWDDLWLNESFAEFISYFCLEKIKDNLKTIKYEQSMSAFFARKNWGYHEDQLSTTTHPISGEVANTTVAASIFDGITYSKGAATMKQLLLLIGEENFSKGLQAFFKKYGFKNATLEDFITELQVFFNNPDLTLQEWRKVWLETASLNKLTPQWNPSNLSEDSELVIIQTPFTDKYPTLRPHKIKIALFKEDCTFDVLEVLIRAEEKTIVKYNGKNNYKGCLLNYEDHTFAKVLLDKTSFDFFGSGKLVHIKDTLTRTMIWRAFFDMVKDGEISSLDYINIFESNIANEISDGIFERHFEYVHAAIGNYTPENYRDELYTRIFYFIQRLIPTVPATEQNRLVILRTQLCEYAHTPLAVQILLKWRDASYEPLKNHEMTIIQKWKAVTRAFTLKQVSNEAKKSLLNHQLSLDQSDTAKLAEAKCRVFLSNEEEFETIYKSFKDPENEKSIALKRSEIEGWNHSFHKPRLLTYKARYFSQVQQVSKMLEEEHFQLFLEQLLPCDDNLAETITGLQSIKLDPEQKFDKNRRDILKMIGDLERRLHAYKKFESGLLL